MSRSSHLQNFFGAAIGFFCGFIICGLTQANMGWTISSCFLGCVIGYFYPEIFLLIKGDFVSWTQRYPILAKTVGNSAWKARLIINGIYGCWMIPFLGISTYVLWHLPENSLLGVEGTKMAKAFYFVIFVFGVGMILPSIQYSDIYFPHSQCRLNDNFLKGLYEDKGSKKLIYDAMWRWGVIVGSGLLFILSLQIVLPLAIIMFVPLLIALACVCIAQKSFEALFAADHWILFLSSLSMAITTWMMFKEFITSPRILLLTAFTGAVVWGLTWTYIWVPIFSIYCGSYAVKGIAYINHVFERMNRSIMEGLKMTCKTLDLLTFHWYTPTVGYAMEKE